jgi:hypothetical protein
VSIGSAQPRVSPATSDLVATELERTPLGPIPIRALDNFQSVFAIERGDRVMMLLDGALDPRVTNFISAFAQGRGAEVSAITMGRPGEEKVPDKVLHLIEEATFVVSTWFSSIMHPEFKRFRSEHGQRWVKITFFRSLDLLQTEAAAFPLDIISLLLTRTASRYPTSGDAVIHLTDPRGTDLRITLDEGLVKKQLSQSRWKGALKADHRGAYVHYLPTHGPNFYDRSTAGDHFPHIDGRIVANMGVGFPDPWDGPAEIVVERNEVVRVTGEGAMAELLGGMMLGAQMVELGCGFNPKAVRNQFYPAGSNSAGALHYGFDLIEESAYIKRTMPDWPEPPIHVDLVGLDATVRINDEVAVDGGVLTAIRDAEVQDLARHYGHPEQLLEVWPWL